MNSFRHLTIHVQLLLLGCVLALGCGSSDSSSSQSGSSSQAGSSSSSQGGSSASSQGSGGAGGSAPDGGGGGPPGMCPPMLAANSRCTVQTSSIDCTHEIAT